MCLCLNRHESGLNLHLFLLGWYNSGVDITKIEKPCPRLTMQRLSETLFLALSGSPCFGGGELCFSASFKILFPLSALLGGKGLSGSQRTQGTGGVGVLECNAPS